MGDATRSRGSGEPMYAHMRVCEETKLQQERARARADCREPTCPSPPIATLHEAVVPHDDCSVPSAQSWQQREKDYLKRQQLR